MLKDVLCKPLVTTKQKYTAYPKIKGKGFKQTTTGTHQIGKEENKRSKGNKRIWKQPEKD